jgi:hypothetical protein
MLKTPLTIPEMIAADPDRRDTLVKDCTRQTDGWSITGVYGWSFWLTDDRNTKNMEPHVGDSVSLYGAIGRPIHGIDLRGESVYWLTPKEREAERAVWLAKYDREKRERYERDREQNDATVASLPELLRKRMERFRMDSPEEDRLDEGYELFCCQQAAVIAEIVKREMPNLDTSAGIEWFRALPYDLQKNLGLDDRHSSNTFGGACMLAKRVLLEGRRLRRSSSRPC